MTASLMQYLPPIGQPQAPQLPASGANKYHGAIAQGYDAKREQSPKWIAEQRIVASFLDDLPSDAWILDAPCGTGRFFDFYDHKGFVVRGIDASADMLALAARKVKDPTGFIVSEKGPVARWAFFHGDMLNSKFPNKCVDAAVCVRITRWIMGQYGPEGIQRMMQEMQRIAKQRIILTARVRDHQFAVPYDLINGALQGWRIHRDEAGYEDAYRLIELGPA